MIRVHHITILMTLAVAVILFFLHWQMVVGMAIGFIGASLIAASYQMAVEETKS